jgi:hypothetical protein
MKPLGAFIDLKRDRLACFEAFVTIHDYGGEMCKYILSTTFWTNETITLCTIEPLYYPAWHIKSFSIEISQ